MRHIRGTARLRVAASLWIVGGAAYLLTEALAAGHFPGYRYTTRYVSDLGRPLDSPLASWMNAAFIAQGIAFALAAASMVAATRLRPGTFAFLALASVYGAGSAIVGIVPSGRGGPPAVVHAGGATAAIVAGNLAVVTAGVVLLRHKHFRIGVVSVMLGVVGLLAGALLVSIDVPEGAFERGAIYTIIGWQLLAAVVVLVSVRRPASGLGGTEECRRT